MAVHAGVLTLIVEEDMLCHVPVWGICKSKICKFTYPLHFLSMSSIIHFVSMSYLTSIHYLFMTLIFLSKTYLNRFYSSMSYLTLLIHVLSIYDLIIHMIYNFKIYSSMSFLNFIKQSNVKSKLATSFSKGMT